MDSFLEACGGHGPLLVTVESPEREGAHRQIVHQPFLVIGRHPRADLSLVHPEVSVRHVYLQMIAGRLYGIDLVSRTGTIWEPDGEDGTAEGPVRGVQIGPYRVRVEISVPTTSTPWTPVAKGLSPLTNRFAGHLDWPLARLEALDSKDGALTCRISRVLTLVGSDATCMIRLKDPGSSRYYAALVRTPVGVWVVDLLSSEGIAVNDARVRHMRLEDRDILQFGRLSLRFRYENVPAGSITEQNPGRFPGASTEIVHAAPTAPVIYSLPAMAPTHAPARAFTPPEGSNDLALRSVLDQVVQMQQQMYEQFHQVFSMLPNLIVSLNQNHITVIREELTQITRLTQEIKALRENQPTPVVAPQMAASPGLTQRSTVASAPAPSPAASRNESDTALPEPGWQFRDPQAIQEVVGNYLKSFERERQSRWEKILNLLKANGK